MDSVNFKKLCRLCLRESDFVTPMFGTVFKSDIPDKLAYCTGLKVTRGDGKPSLICQVCIDNLHISYAFKQTCLKSNRRFFRHFYGIKHEVKIIVERLNVDVKLKMTEVGVQEIKEEVDKTPIIRHHDVHTENSDINNKNYDDNYYVNNEYYDNNDNNDMNNDNYYINDEYYNNNDVNKDNDDIDSKSDINLIGSTAEPLGGDDDDDFYWQNDEQLMNAPDPNKQVNSKLRKKETKPRGTYKQRVDKDGKPKLSKKQLQRERAKSKHPKPDVSTISMFKKRGKKPLAYRYCECCDRVFPSQAERDKHAEDVHGGITNCETKIICEICGKSYARHYIDYHMLSHFPPEFSCEEPGCTYKTIRSSYMDKHKVVHLGADRPSFPCNECSRVFNARSTLNTHIRRDHKKIRNHKCSFCDKLFFTNTKKVIHEQGHTDDKPYMCGHCPSRFRRRDMWKIHLLKQHGVVPPPVKGGPKINRVVETNKLKDAGKLVALKKTDDSVDRTDDSVDRTDDNVD